jgi:hypothetical protein
MAAITLRIKREGDRAIPNAPREDSRRASNKEMEFGHDLLFVRPLKRPTGAVRAVEFVVCGEVGPFPNPA